MDEHEIESAVTGAVNPPLDPPTQSDARGAAKRCQIVDGARKVFLDDGFEGASIDDIVRTAGVSKATLYRYFPDKSALFAAVVGEECAAQARHFPEVCRGDRSLEAVLIDLARKQIEFVVSPFAQRIFRIAVAESERFPDIGRSFYASGPRRNRERLAPILAAAAASGEIAVPDADHAAQVFFQICSAEIMFERLFSIGEAPSEADIDARTRSAVRTFLTAYRYPPEPAA